MAKKETEVFIQEPNFGEMRLRIIGTAPLVMHRFAEKAQREMEETQAAGQQAKSRKKREPKDFDALAEGAKHRAAEGWCGIPAGAIRSAMIAACRMTDVKMTHAKMAFFIEADGFEAEGTPLVKITKGEPTNFTVPVRIANGSFDLRPRPKWDAGWEAIIRITFDQEFISAQSLVNLLARAGAQVGLLEGRPFSKDSHGMGWGTFRVGEVKNEKRSGKK